MKRWVMFCEAAGDHRTAAALIDEALALRCAPWVRELLEVAPESVRVWHDDAEARRPWFDLHLVYALARRLGVKVPYGHFGGAPAAPGAKLLQTVQLIARRMQQLDRDADFEAVVLVWDMDKQRGGRHAGLAQAAAEGTLPGVALVLGCPDPIRETWVLAGFDPEDDTERARLDTERRALGFYPHEEPHRLTAGDEHALKHAKRVLTALGVSTAEREAACLRIGDDIRRERLRVRGMGCGLEAFLRAVETELAPRVEPSARS